MTRPTIITIKAGRDCQGDAKQPIDIEIHEDMIAIDTVPRDSNSPLEGDRVYLDIADIHQALLEAGHADASPQLNELLAILNPATLDD